ncbi:hypothetical protein F5878DRAFT_632522 [Lentinula raphanica]|uniref:Uncharacterized protein n=1 Tax=Lentinula raphanica TaxID=153919 RepID=A0AA38NZL7_9AGAR|nr:hypothetical protein F5878DRAFT_632522 [Lentinula raphanica]
MDAAKKTQLTQCQPFSSSTAFSLQFLSPIPSAGQIGFYFVPRTKSSRAHPDRHILPMLTQSSLLRNLPLLLILGAFVLTSAAPVGSAVSSDSDNDVESKLTLPMAGLSLRKEVPGQWQPIVTFPREKNKKQKTPYLNPREPKAQQVKNAIQKFVKIIFPALKTIHQLQDDPSVSSIRVKKWENNPYPIETVISTPEATGKDESKDESSQSTGQLEGQSEPKKDVFLYKQTFGLTLPAVGQGSGKKQKYTRASVSWRSDGNRVSGKISKLGSAYVEVQDNEIVGPPSLLEKMKRQASGIA